MTNTIYCVFNPQGRAPFFPHHTKSSAETEAKRLAKNNPGYRFYVMESIGVAEKIDVAYYATKKPDPAADLEDEIPF